MIRNKSVYANFNQLLNEHFLPALVQPLHHQIAFIRHFEQNLSDFYISLNLVANEDWSAHHRVFQEILQFQQKVYALTQEDLKAEEGDFSPETFHTAADAYVSGLKKTSKEIQKADRFATETYDHSLVKVGKLYKRKTLALSQLPVQAQNILRKRMKKELLPPVRWLQTIPYRNLTAYYMQYELAEQMLSLVESMYRSIAGTTTDLWKIEEEIFTIFNQYLNQTYGVDKPEELPALPVLPADAFQQTLEEALDKIDHQQKAIEATAAELLDAVFSEYNDAYEKTGTFEMPARRFSQAGLKKKADLVKKVYARQLQGWKNTLFVMVEDWNLDLEFNQLCMAMLSQQVSHQRCFEEKIAQRILPQLETTFHCIEEIRHSLLENLRQDSDKNIRTALMAGKKSVDNPLIRFMLPHTIEVLYKQQLPETLDQLQASVDALIAAISEKRGITSSPDYNKPVKSSDIDYIPPRQIVTFESLPALLKTITSVKSQVANQQVDMQKRINEIGQISYFNLEAALSVLDNKETQTQDPEEIASQGLERALSNGESIRVSLLQTTGLIHKELTEGILEFNRQVIELKNNNYALELKFRIAKAKAIERTRMYKQKAIQRAKNLVPQTLGFFKTTYRESSSLLQSYQKRMGISANTAKVSSEISDFLSETESAINRLPYVYQRLFSIQPLEEEIFYEERQKEMTSICKAYQNWNKNRYAHVLVVGEKGSGITTLLNFFIKRITDKGMLPYPVERISTHHQIWTEAHFFEFFNRAFPDHQFKHVADIATYLDEEKRIIVLENLEHMYLKKIGGFACLKLLFELISKTSRKVFWLSSSTVYAWQYLNKSIHISDYFEYTIQLENLSDEQMSEVILKRHRASGYSLTFTSNLLKKNKKKLEKLSEAEQQAYLQEEYFKDLNKISDGNFSIAQLFWLRSAIKVTKDSITIGSLREMDFSFLQSIALSKIITLHLLILHDGLTETQYATIMHQGQKENREQKRTQARLSLLQLLDDGLIVKTEDLYLVNPLLYRPVVQLLQTKNFLH